MGRSIHIRIAFGFGKDGKNSIDSKTTANSGKGAEADDSLSRVAGEFTNTRLMKGKKAQTTRMNNGNHEKTIAGRRAAKEIDDLFNEVEPIEQELEIDEPQLEGFEPQLEDPQLDNGGF